MSSRLRMILVALFAVLAGMWGTLAVAGEPALPVAPTGPADAATTPAPELVDAAGVPIRAAEASDPDNCLLCHRFPGLSRLDSETGDLRLFFVSERFHADGAGPHTHVACTGCHQRAEVEKIPHADVTPVDCSQSCHLVSDSGANVEFSHKVPTESLEKSVHAARVLDAQAYSTPLLHKGQSACLYCHDDPTYRMPDVADKFHRGLSPTVRCKTCHDAGLPVDTERAIRHVGSRLGDQRPAREAARACAVCHSDPKVLETTGMHDAVSSYMRSFHGKASSLGMLDAPVCTDCHSSEEGNPHLMLAADDPVSPTSPDNRKLTCLSMGCHDNAEPQLSAAAVHMRVTPETETAEYYVTAAFVILTAGTMTLYFVLLVLELLNIVVRRTDDEHLEAVALARAVQAHPVGRERLVRLDVHQRFQHWVLVISFLTLVVTGLPLKFAKVEWMPILVQILGGLQTTRLLHRGAAIVISIAFVYHIGYLFVKGRADLARRRAANPERGILKHLFFLVYESPMMVRPVDVKDFVFLFLHLLGLRKHRPAQGRFHFSQKFEYWAVFWGMTMIGVSGAMLWMEDPAAQAVGGRALNFAYIVHSDEAFLALLYIAVVHFFAVVFSPAVFPLNLGSLTGDMPPFELAENHLGHLRAVAAELGITATKQVRPHGFAEVMRQIGRRSFSLVQAALIGGLGFISVSFLVHELSGGERAVEVDKVPLRLDAGLLTKPALEDDASGAGGASRNALQRGPLSHFHAIPTWYEPDPGNACTNSGCHSALPHGERKEVRAFLNMHTTFVDCQVCHRDQDLHGVGLTWLSLEDRTEVEDPAVLRLAAILETAPQGDVPAEWATTLATTLGEAVEESGNDPELVRWKAELKASRVGGVRYSVTVAEMAARIGRHGHGEYGEKIGIPAASGRRWTPDAEQQAAIDRIRGPEGSSLHIDERKALITTVHKTLKKPEVECQLCHTADNGLVDFPTLGYSPARVEALRSNTIARQAQAVESGTTFFLPNVLNVGEPDPGSIEPAPEVTP